MQPGISCILLLIIIRIDVVPEHRKRSMRIWPAMGTMEVDLYGRRGEYLSHLMIPSLCSGKIPNAVTIATMSVS